MLCEHIRISEDRNLHINTFASICNKHKDTQNINQYDQNDI